MNGNNTVNAPESAAAVSCPRIMIAAPASGSGKTLVTCGLMKALQEKGFSVRGMKCGPDFIDPLFHEKALGVKSRNIDGFLMSRPQMRRALAAHGTDADITVMEGVMGYYDGIGGTTAALSSYETASVTKTPVILVIDASGCGTSIVPLIRGFRQYRSDCGIAGVILNKVSDAFAEKLAELIPEETDMPVLGHLPKDPALAVESRHLGLVLPDEIRGIEERLARLAEMTAERFDLEKIMKIAREAPPPAPDGLLPRPDGAEYAGAAGQDSTEYTGAAAQDPRRISPVKIAMASDEAFCFLYQDNVELLESLGAQIVPFSPVHDAHLPEGTCGILLPGGYPELYAEALSGNVSMRQEIKAAADARMPIMAECGGFLYLHKSLKDKEGKVYPMAGALDADAWYAGKTGRFGYILVKYPEAGVIMRAHEFHAYESGEPGINMMAEKTLSGRVWRCIHAKNGGMWGFPHIYYPSAPQIAETFVNAAGAWADGNRA